MRQDYTSRAVQQNRICRQHVLCESTQIDTKTKEEFHSEFQKIVDVHHELLDTFSRTKILTQICYMSDKVIQQTAARQEILDKLEMLTNT
jgi:hypothetical protein